MAINIMGNILKDPEAADLNNTNKVRPGGITVVAVITCIVTRVCAGATLHPPLD